MNERKSIINQQNHYILNFEIYIQQREKDILKAKEYIELIKDYIHYLKSKPRGYNFVFGRIVKYTIGKVIHIIDLDYKLSVCGMYVTADILDYMIPSEVSNLELDLPLCKKCNKTQNKVWRIPILRIIESKTKNMVNKRK